MTPSRPEYKKTPQQRGGNSYLLIEKSPKQQFFDKNIQQDIILTQFLRNRSGFKSFLLQAILRCFCSKFRESHKPIRVKYHKENIMLVSFILSQPFHTSTKTCPRTYPRIVFSSKESWARPFPPNFNPVY
jgi:hypothetical protein